MYLERLTVLGIIEANTIELAQNRFIEAEHSVLECEHHLTNLSALESPNCNIQSVGKNYWRITSKTKPAIEVHVSVDEKTGLIKRINWRQAFE
nr:hypothetical protein [Polynucleobacter sp. UK-Kesae-W10]